MEVMREDDDVGENDWQPIVNRMVTATTDDIEFFMLLWECLQAVQWYTYEYLNTMLSCVLKKFHV